ncbi:MAG: translation initiation factor IF-2 [Spirochaetes bacterium GWD1_27_9]|nr:MAG: translation initiation factor IF-2 [Spirochaetes bacterium GWB1_27_13]OHD27926.1 MAG: translation initiation factor IF-2 [Spirochaetes bacterium GWC1_27_15]OHD30743.1 MAG: translation initiation factor IF-2 [Spirochaetes bacterium GWD1_27_9]
MGNEDKDKAELIKKTENKTENKLENQPSKKIVVVKKVKKVIIKKHQHKTDQIDEKLEEKKEDVVLIEKEEKKIETQPPKREPIKIILSKDRDKEKDKRFNTNTNTNTPNNNQRPYTPRPFGQKPTFGQKLPFGQKPTFGQNRGPGSNIVKPFNKGGKTTPTTQPIINTEKDRNRKRLNQKKYDNVNKYEDEEEIAKAFNKKKKEKHQMDFVPSQIDIIDVVSISDLAKKMNLKSSVIISKLMELGTMVTINDKIDSDTASIVAAEFNCKVNVVSLYDQTVIEEEKEKDVDLILRPPIVTVMGHVDHGKTKLLDAIRSANVVAGESGGITQHIGAYCVVRDNGQKITFIDTPGHEAFTMMRARGAQVTDIVVLVVAADDGVMPQTVEAIKHAKEAKVPILVAINKIDKPAANPDRVKQQLSDFELLPEDWGGQTLYCGVSALKKLGIKELLDSIILQSEMLNLKVSFHVRAKGFILESKIEQGRGVVATVLILKGTLRVGDFFVAGVYSGKIRSIYNDVGEKVDFATPSMPVEITGLENVPKAGDPFNVTASEKESKIIAAKRQELNKMEEAKLVKKISLKDILSQKKEGEVQEIKVVIKADVQGSVGAIKESLEKLSNAEIKLVTVYAGVGAINENDVMLAVASNAIIIGFHVRPNPKAMALADKEKVEIRRYNIIFDVIEDIKSSMEGMIKPELLEEFIGNIEVRQVFKISKIGTVAGCIVTSGKVKRNSMIRVMRDDVVIHSGKIATLKRFKDDASEVHEGTECGIGIENYNNVKEGDIFEAYEIKEIARKLEDIKPVEVIVPEEKPVVPPTTTKE